jgi:hypothetical protein
VNVTQIRGKVLALLTELGGNERDVAATLDRLGVTGSRDCASRCPIANYLHERLTGEGVRDVAVGDLQASLILRDGTVVRAWLPRAVRNFIALFDGGHHFQELVAPGGGADRG